MTFVIFIIVLSVLIILYNYKENQKSKSKYSISEHIRNNYIKRTIPIEELIILTSEFYEDDFGDELLSRISILDSFLKRKQNTKELKQVSFISFNDFFLHNNRKVLNSVSIYIPEIIIRKKLQQKQSVDIYYKEDDTFRYYYDLSFLY